MAHDPTTDGPLAATTAMTAGTGSGESCFFTMFDAVHAARVASWVRTERELAWLAPATPPPLTPEKVVDWAEQGRSRRFLFWNDPQSGPIGYAELNPMPNDPRLLWIGHFVVDPAWRGRSLGSSLAGALLATAFRHYRATEVVLVVVPENVAAVRCYERAGFMPTGRESKFFKTTQREYTFLRMSLLRARYRQLAAAGRLPSEATSFFPRDRIPLRPGGQ
jgi:RimJ/RimL family protein N-acetyltransferase